MRNYRLFILPTDEVPWLEVDEKAVSITPTGRPETIDVAWPACAGLVDSPEGEVLLRFRPKSPPAYDCYLVAMMADYTDGYLNRYSRSL